MIHCLLISTPEFIHRGFTDAFWFDILFGNFDFFYQTVFVFLLDLHLNTLQRAIITSSRLQCCEIKSPVGKDILHSSSL